jgi:hypothetical protein
MRPLRPPREVLRDWSTELSAKLGRPQDEIITRGLTAHDFSPDSSVEVRDPSGMVVRFSFAFAVIRPTSSQAAVFTEHSGYVEFDLIEDSVVAEIQENIYRQR